MTWLTSLLVREEDIREEDIREEDIREEDIHEEDIREEGHIEDTSERATMQSLKRPQSAKLRKRRCDTTDAMYTMRTPQSSSETSGQPEGQRAEVAKRSRRRRKGRRGVVGVEFRMNGVCGGSGSCSDDDVDGGDMDEEEDDEEEEAERGGAIFSYGRDDERDAAGICEKMARLRIPGRYRNSSITCTAIACTVDRFVLHFFS